MRDIKRKKFNSKMLVGALLAGLVFFSLGPATAFADVSESSFVDHNVKVSATVNDVPSDSETGDAEGEPVPNSLLKARDGLNNFFQQFKDIRLYGDQNEWALVNLILAVIGLILAIKAACSFRKKHRRIGFLIITIPIGIAGALVFYLTENMKNQVVFVDSWTILGAVIFIVEIIIYNLSYRR